MSELESPLAELRKMVISQKTALLPPDAPFPSFEHLHAAMQEYDRLISQAVIAVIQQRAIEVPIAEIQAAQNHAQRALTQPDLPSGRELAGYQKYKQRLDHMAELIQQV